jgi:hypothetical protein
MYRRDDPRLRRRLDQLGHTVEAATEHAQENLYTFSQRYIAPCFASVNNCLGNCTESCFPHLDRRRQRGQPRGRAEASFDFYDDWDEEENDALLGWSNGNDELNRLLAGSGASQPGRESGMSYGTRGDAPKLRRKSTVQREGPDPNIIPASNYLGFMERLPWNLGRRGLRYKPSAADLQEHPGVHRVTAEEQEPLIEDSDEEGIYTGPRTHKRVRSSTNASGHTTSSLSSRGDLFPSDDEDDAVPLDDEFAMVLERRTTGSGPDEGGSRNSRSTGSKSRSRLSTRTVSSKSLHSPGAKSPGPNIAEVQTMNVPTLSDLQAEEERVRREEEEVIEKKRVAAKKLAEERGLTPTESKPATPRSPSPVRPTGLDSKSPDGEEMFPFPTFDPSETAPSREDVIPSLDEPPQFEPTDPISIPSPPPHDEHVSFVPAALPHFSQSLD